MTEVSEPELSRFTHRPWLDGLRGFAVVGVLLFHNSKVDLLRADTWTGGFLGVDVFFVLSGFLITTLLTVEHAHSGRINLGAFWARRARRLFPALLVMLAGVALIARSLQPQPGLGELRGEALSALFYVANWYHQGHGGLTSHAWSLSIEEQWYLLWPIVLGAVFYATRTRLVLRAGVVTMLLLGAVAWTQVLERLSDHGRLYYGTDVRAQELLAGACLALWLVAAPPLRRRWVSVAIDVAGLVALAAIAGLFWFATTDSAWLYQWGFAAMGGATATVIAAGMIGAGGVRRVLQPRVLCAVGVISYGLYLYHWPLFWWLRASRVDLDPIPLFALRLAVTTTVATVSYLVIERPIRRGALPGRRLAVALGSASLIVVLAVVAVTGAQGVAADDITARLREAAAAAPADAAKVLVIGDSSIEPLQTRSPFRRSTDVGFAVAMRCSLAGGLPIVGGQRVPLPFSCARPQAPIDAAVDAFDPDVAILAVGAELALDRDVAGTVYRFGTDELSDLIDERLDAARVRMTRRGARFAVLAPPCNMLPGAENAERSRWLTETTYEWAAMRGVDVLDVAAVQCPAGRPGTVDGSPMFVNGALTASGADAIWQWIGREVDRLGLVDVDVTPN